MKSIIMRYSCFLVFIYTVMGLISTNINAQSTKNTSKIKIVYIDSLTSQRVENITTLLFDINDSITPIMYAYSNYLGEVSFSVKEGHTYRVKASFLSDVVYDEAFMINKEESYVERKVLISNTKELEEVVVLPKPIGVAKGKMTFQIQSAGLGNALVAYNAYDILSRTPRVQVAGNQVLIDGKPAEVHVNGVKRINAQELLSMISADNIKKLEVQFGRNASTSGQTSGGVVSISLKEQRGLSSAIKNSLSLSGKPFNNSSTSALMQDGNFSLLYGTDKWQLYSRFSTHNGTYTGINHESSYHVLSNSEKINQTTEGKNSKNNSCVGIIGMSGIFGQHSLLAEIEGDFVFKDKKKQNNEFNQPNRKDEYLHYYSESSQDKKTDLGSITFTHLWESKELQKKKLQTSMAYIFYRDKEISLIDTKFEKGSQLRKEEGMSKAFNNLLFFKSEWSSAFKEAIGLNAGVELNITSRTNDYKHRTESINDAVEYYRYKELLGAAFVSLSKSWDKFFVSGGIRMEYTYLQSKNKGVSQGYTNWLPSFSVSYTTDNLNDLSFFYSRYLLRPSFDLLSNYRVKVNDFLYFVGNPLLKSQQTDQFALSYTTSNFSIFAEYQLHKNVIEEMFFTKDDIIFLTNDNVDTRHEIGVGGGCNGNLFSFWRIILNGGLQCMWIPNGYVQKNIIQGYASLHNTLTITPKWQVNINLNAASPWIMQTRWVDGRFTSEIEVNYTTSNKRWILGCKIQNLFAKHSSTTKTINPYIVNTERSQVAVPCLLFRVSYHFQSQNKTGTPIKKITTENRDRL